MNKKILYALIAVIVAIILVITVFEVLVVPPSTTASLTVSVTPPTSSVGQTLTFAAFITGGTPSQVIFNFGDGTTGMATHLSGNEYTATHSYNSAGKYLVTANATVNGKIVNNLKSIFEVSVIPASVSPTVATEITAPNIITSTQIVSPGSTVTLTASTLEPPTATNWSIGYYIWNFGDGSMHTNYTIFNTSSGNFMPGGIAHLYSAVGIYSATLGVITFNATNYVPTTYTSNGINYTYYPLSDLTSILSSSGNYYNNTYVITIVANSNAQLLSSTVPLTNPSEIILTDIASGGSYSFDPAITYNGISFEVIFNAYETLIEYNGTSSAQLFPLAATEIPTVANGGISTNYLNYTFTIRPGLKFANGDPLTAWDAYTSFIRTLLFVADTPGTAGWILGQDLLPGGGYASNATSYQNVTSAITVDNATQSITFHLLKPDPAFLGYLSNSFGSAILDYSWLVAHGAGITFTPAGFAAYITEGNEGNYNTYVQNNVMGSGAYMVKNYIIGQSVTLAPNPYYTPIAGVPGYNHVANDTIFIQWEKDPSTALLIAENGLTDLIEDLPTSDYPIMAHLESEGKIKVDTFQTLDLFYYAFNFDINTTMLSSLGTGFTVPQYYFANLDVRRAFAYAFNYTNYLDNIIGNSKYGADFGFHYTGFLCQGLAGYMSTAQLQQAGAVVPYYNLTIAKQYMEESGLYNVTINIPILVYAGDPINFAGANMWGAALNAIDPNIHASAAYIEIDQIIGDMVTNQNPMPICILDWTPDFPFPSANMIPMYQEAGWSGAANGYNPQLLASVGQTNASNEDALMNQYIADGENTGNASLAIKYYDEAEVLAINLTFYTYLYQVNQLWYYSPSIHDIQLYPIYGGEIALMYLSKY
jgi:ABC-type transport system substrate-binding protein